MPAQLTRTGNVLPASYFREETFEFVQNKIKTLQAVNVTTPEQVDREITEAEKNTMYKNYRPGRLPDIVNACDEAPSCLYTVTPDSNFVIDFFPEQPQVLIVLRVQAMGSNTRLPSAKFLQNWFSRERAGSISVALVSRGFNAIPL